MDQHVAKFRLRSPLSNTPLAEPGSCPQDHQIIELKETEPANEVESCKFRGKPGGAPHDTATGIDP